MPQNQQSRANRLLNAALQFRSAEPRSHALPTTFQSAEEAHRTWRAVLLHEAREEFQTPLEEMPACPVLHPVDIDTEEPGIVVETEAEDQQKQWHVLRAEPMEEEGAAAAAEAAAIEEPEDMVFSVEAAEARLQSAQREEAELKTAETRAQKQEVSQKRKEEAARKRAEETPEAKEERLQKAREKRKAKQEAKKEANAAPEGEAISDPKRPKTRVDPVPASDPSEPDASCLAVWTEDTPAARKRLAKRRGLLPPTRKRGDSSPKYFAHPVPHDRHLHALARTKAPHPKLLAALLKGEGGRVPAVRCIQGPPGTGKTRALVEELASVGSRRVFLCAPTNVGAANVYLRCVAEGYGDQTSLVLAADRVPPGTPVQSNDPHRQFVCATISARAGFALQDQEFSAVFVDEAALCMEAWVWTLLRPEVEDLVLAGDVHQLPALVSASGKELKHDRSLMERLVCDLQYPHVRSLTEQHRMAPELAAFPNQHFYGGTLTQGAHAPAQGSVVRILLTQAQEEAAGTSWKNSGEAAAVAAYVRTELKTDELKKNAVLLAPYQAQCRALLAQRTGVAVHTLDSFQGREADTVVLSCVRDGSQGLGFWTDPRRVAVALTRARRTLVLVASQTNHWPDTSPLVSYVR